MSIPLRRRSGQNLAGGYFCTLISLIGDLDYFQKTLGTPVSTNHHGPCCQCRCQYSGNRSWLDNRVGSTWQGTVLTAHNWKEQWQTSCLLFQLPGCNCWTLSYDLMHNLWIGWLQMAYGSIMWMLCFQLLPLDPLTNLRTVWAYLKEWQKLHKEPHKYRQRLDKLSMFVKTSGFPKLKGRASDIKGLHGALKACWNHFMRPDCQQDQQVSAFLTLNSEIHELLDAFSPKYGFFNIPSPQCEELYNKGLAMSQLHVCLLEYFQAQEVQIWNITTKTHFCLHTLFLARYIHPSLTWAFKGETTMKAVQTLWRSCLAGNKHWAVCKVAALKMRHLMHIQNQGDWKSDFYLRCAASSELFGSLTCDPKLTWEPYLWPKTYLRALLVTQDLLESLTCDPRLTWEPYLWYIVFVEKFIQENQKYKPENQRIFDWKIIFFKTKKEQ